MTGWTRPGVSGANIDGTKGKIETMMDTVVQGL